ncbi:MAG: hypothetical protein V1754_15345 [Pseudomonadota bacterium]
MKRSSIIFFLLAFFLVAIGADDDDDGGGCGCGGGVEKQCDTHEDCLPTQKCVAQMCKMMCYGVTNGDGSDGTPCWTGEHCESTICDNQGTGPTCKCQPCTPRYEISGTWTDTYKCVTTGGQCFVGSDTLYITQTHSDITVNNTNEGIFKGKLCNSILNLKGPEGMPGISEKGEWIFQDANSFRKTSKYTDTKMVANCEGRGIRGTTPPEAYICN